MTSHGNLDLVRIKAGTATGTWSQKREPRDGSHSKLDEPIAPSHAVHTGDAPQVASPSGGKIHHQIWPRYAQSTSRRAGHRALRLSS